MGGRGYHNNVKGYLDSSGRTREYRKAFDSGYPDIDFLVDRISPEAPKNPEFSNTACKTYVLLGKNDGLKSIIFYGEDHRQKKVIALDHQHGDLGVPHVDIGFEDTGREHRALTEAEEEFVALIRDVFNRRNGGPLK